MNECEIINKGYDRMRKQRLDENKNEEMNQTGFVPFWPICHMNFFQ